MFYVTGDMHGDAQGFLLRMHMLDPKPGDVMLCLGDVGLKCGQHVQSGLLDAMSMSPATLLIMCGDHDALYVCDWRTGSYLGAVHLGEKDWCGVRVLFDDHDPNILYLPDEGSAFEHNGHRCLVVPGRSRWTAASAAATAAPSSLRNSSRTGSSRICHPSLRGCPRSTYCEPLASRR